MHDRFRSTLWLQSGVAGAHLLLDGCECASSDPGGCAAKVQLQRRPFVQLAAVHGSSHAVHDAGFNDFGPAPHSDAI